MKREDGYYLLVIISFALLILILIGGIITSNVEDYKQTFGEESLTEGSICRGRMNYESITEIPIDCLKYVKDEINN